MASVVDLVGSSCSYQVAAQLGHLAALARAAPEAVALATPSGHMLAGAHCTSSGCKASSPGGHVVGAQPTWAALVNRRAVTSSAGSQAGCKLDSGWAATEEKVNWSH